MYEVVVFFEREYEYIDMNVSEQHSPCNVRMFGIDWEEMSKVEKCCTYMMNQDNMSVSFI